MLVYIVNILLVCVYAFFLLREKKPRVKITADSANKVETAETVETVEKAETAEIADTAEKVETADTAEVDGKSETAEAVKPAEDFSARFKPSRFTDIFNKRGIFLVLCFTQCLILIAVRYDVGLDYYMYAKGFQDMAASGFSSLTYEDWEIGYILLNKLIGLFTRDVNVMMFIMAFLCLIGPFFMIWRYSKNPFMSVFLFLNTYLFYLDMNFIRQGIAMSIMCMAYGFLQERKMWRFILLIALAATFHLPVLYLIPVYFFSLIRLNMKTLPIYAGAVIVYFLASDAVLNLVLSHFHQEYLGSRFIRLGLAKYYAIIPLVLVIAIIALLFYMDFKQPKHLNVLAHLMLMMGFWQVAMTKHSLFERFSYYTMPFMLIAIPEAIYIFKEIFAERTSSKLAEKYADDPGGLAPAQAKAEKRVKIIMLSINGVILLAMFFYNMMGLVIPDRGAHGALPYQTIFGNLKLPSIDGWFKH